MSEINEKLQITLDYFKELGIIPPTEVVNAIHDVFDENDNIDNVDFYFKDGIEDFEKDLTLENRVIVNLNGKSEGQAYDVFTYYGEVSISLSEFTQLFNGKDMVKDDITRVDNRETPSKLLNPENYVVILLEKTEFEAEKNSEGTYNVTDILMIYCPIISEEE